MEVGGHRLHVRGLIAKLMHGYMVDQNTRSSWPLLVQIPSDQQKNTRTQLRSLSVYYGRHWYFHDIKLFQLYVKTSKQPLCFTVMKLNSKRLARFPAYVWEGGGEGSSMCSRITHFVLDLVQRSWPRAARPGRTQSPTNWLKEKLHCTTKKKEGLLGDLRTFLINLWLYVPHF